MQTLQSAQYAICFLVLFCTHSWRWHLEYLDLVSASRWVNLSEMMSILSKEPLTRIFLFKILQGFTVFSEVPTVVEAIDCITRADGTNDVIVVFIALGVLSLHNLIQLSCWCIDTIAFWKNPIHFLLVEDLV